MRAGAGTSSRHLVVAPGSLLDWSDGYATAHRRPLASLAALVRFAAEPKLLGLAWADGMPPTLYLTASRDALLACLLDAAQARALEQGRFASTAQHKSYFDDCRAWPGLAWPALAWLGLAWADVMLPMLCVRRPVMHCWRACWTRLRRGCQRCTVQRQVSTTKMCLA